MNMYAAMFRSVDFIRCIALMMIIIIIIKKKTNFLGLTLRFD